MLNNGESFGSPLLPSYCGVNNPADTATPIQLLLILLIFIIKKLIIILALNLGGFMENVFIYELPVHLTDDEWYEVELWNDLETDEEESA